MLPEVLEAANPALDELNAALPPTRAFAREIIPAVRETPATIDAALPWIAQTRALVSPAELQGLVRDLQPAVADLARAHRRHRDASCPQVDLFNRCLIENVLPTGDDVIADGPRTTGREELQGVLPGLVGLPASRRTSTATAPYTRFQTGGGDQRGTDAPRSARPAVRQRHPPAAGHPSGPPAKRPPYNRTEPCHTQRRPDLDGARTGGGP